jgi:exo-beta-1,3-glucanase (GH17 family)
MKELEKENPVSEAVDIKPVVRTKLLGQISVVKGLILWDLNEQSGQIVKAEFETFYDAEKKMTRKRVITKEGHSYVQALNMTNAARKFLRAGLVRG